MARGELAIRKVDELTTLCMTLRINEIKEKNKENEDDGNELKKE